MYCLDTCFIIDLLSGEEKAIEKYRTLHTAFIYTTSITVYELLRAIEKNSKKTEDLNAFFEQLEVRGFGFTEAKETAKISIELEKEGNRLSQPDIFIAGIARANQLTVLTRDKAFKKIRNLKVETY
jgi:tRNA(fMet)-specific endonuclease VapC